MGRLDRLPRHTLDLGSRRVPAFRSLGIAGFQVSTALVVLAALAIGVPVVVALGIAASAGLSSFAWALVRRTVTGRESLVLLEHVWAAYVVVGAFLWAVHGGSLAAASAEPGFAAGLDVFSVALPVFLAFGRAGCLTVGCCHGVPGPFGIRYPAGHGHPAYLVGTRLLPVQLLEAVLLVVCAALGFALLGRTPGSATVWFLVAYALVRFGTEALRADRRPHVWGVSVARIMSLVQTAVAVVLAEAWLRPGGPDRATAAGAIALAVAAAGGATVHGARRRNPLTSPDHLDEVWAGITAGAARDPGDGAPEATVTALGMSIVVTVDDDGVHASLAHPQHATLGVATALAPGDIRQVRGITHLWFGPDDARLGPPWRDRSPAPGRAGYFARAGGNGSGPQPAAAAEFGARR